MVGIDRNAPVGSQILRLKRLQEKLFALTLLIRVLVKLKLVSPNEASKINMALKKRSDVLSSHINNLFNR